MKKIFIMLGLSLLMAGCQSDDLLVDNGVANNGDGNVNFSLSIPDMMEESRADDEDVARNSALGGISNVDMTKYDLRYQLAIYRYDSHDETVEPTDSESGEVTTSTKTVTTLVQVITPQVRTVNSYQPVTYSLNLTPGKTYKAVVWADFVELGSQEDLHYDTTDLKAITCKDDADHQLNDESRDAFFVSEKFTVDQGGTALSLVLKRPFAKLRIVATDWNKDGVIMPDNFKLTYKNCYRATELDIVGVDGDGDNIEAETYTAQINPEAKDYTLNYDAADCNRTVIVDYLMTDGSYKSKVHFNLQAYNGETLLAEKEISTDIPVRRNWLTTVMGNLLSVDGEITVSCDEMFEDEYNRNVTGETITAVKPEVVNNVYRVSNPAELVWISDSVSLMNNATVVLTNDIDLNGALWTPINTNGNITLFNGQGHTIYNLYNFNNTVTSTGAVNIVNYAGLFGSASKIVIENVNMQNVTVDFATSHVGGIVGCLGANGSQDDVINEVKNCTVKDFFFRAVLTDNYQCLYAYNAGAIVGILDHGKITDCHAENVDIENGWRAGGIVGFVHANGNFTETTISGCTAKNVTVWNKYVADGTDDDYYAMRQLGSIVGCADGASFDTNTLHLVGCSASDVTYKWFGYYAYYAGGWYDLPLYELHDGDEGGEYSLTVFNRTFDYGPQDALYGYADKITITKE